MPLWRVHLSRDRTVKERLDLIVEAPSADEADDLAEEAAERGDFKDRCWEDDDEEEPSCGSACMGTVLSDDPDAEPDLPVKGVKTE